MLYMPAPATIASKSVVALRIHSDYNNSHCALPTAAASPSGLLRSSRVLLYGYGSVQEKPVLPQDVATSVEVAFPGQTLLLSDTFSADDQAYDQPEFQGVSHNAHEARNAYV
jgi:hypothetical protein